ncbi:DUF1857 family protein, partial [archaeon]
GIAQACVCCAPSVVGGWVFYTRLRACVRTRVAMQIHSPDKYVPGAHDVRILEEDAAHVLRQMAIGEDNVVREHITWDEAAGLVTFTMVDHARMKGSVVNIVEALSDSTCKLTFRMDWTGKGDFVVPDMQPAIEGAVKLTKRVIESHAAGKE